jgi:hypothetical protein
MRFGIKTAMVGGMTLFWTGGAPILPENYVPEPSSLVALACGLVGILAQVRKRRSF